MALVKPSMKNKFLSFLNLSKAAFVRCNNFLPLCIAFRGDQVQYGLFITAWGTQSNIFNNLHLIHSNLSLTAMWNLLTIQPTSG